MKKIQIAIVDDHKMVAEGIAKFLEGETFKICTIITRYENILEGLKNAEIDVLLLDVNFGYGKSTLDLLDKLKNKDVYGFKIIVLTSYDTNYIRYQAFSKGADGFIGKIKGIEFIEPLIMECINGEEDSMPLTFSKVLKITKRELETLILLYEGLSEKEIAVKLFVDLTTVKTHKKHLFEKLNVKKQSELTKNCIEEGVLLV